VLLTVADKLFDITCSLYVDVDVKIAPKFASVIHTLNYDLFRFIKEKGMWRAWGR
jgi:hypothetical protein